MNKNDALKAMIELNKKYVGWYMFVESDTMPGKGIRHAFPKAFTSTEYVEKLLVLLKGNPESFFAISLSQLHKPNPDYFIYYTSGGTTMYKTIVQVLCGASLDRSSRIKIDNFLLNQSNRTMIERFRESGTRYPADMVRTMHKKNAIVHEKDPVFVVTE